MLVHGSVNTKQQTVFMSAAIKAIFNYKLWPQEVSKAYLQGKKVLIGYLYLLPKQVFILNNLQLLKLVKPFYGLTDRGNIVI